MSKVIKNDDGVTVVEGTPSASIIKDVDKFFASKPPERMAGESVSQPRKLDPRAINTRRPTPKDLEQMNNPPVESPAIRSGGRPAESEVVLDTFMGTGGRRSDPRREKVYHPIVKSKTPKDQRPVKEDRGPVNTTGRMVDPKPPTGGRGGRTGGRRSDPRPDRDRGRGGRRGRRRVRDEAFERRRRGGSPRRISREERRRRVRVANTRK